MSTPESDTGFGRFSYRHIPYLHNPVPFLILNRYKKRNGVCQFISLPVQVPFFSVREPYGSEFFSMRLWFSSHTALNFFLHGCGYTHCRTKIKSCAVTEILTTACVFYCQ